MVNWDRGGDEIKNNMNERGTVRSNVWMLRDTAANCFLRPGLTWPLRTQGGLSLRAMPAGCIFSHKGPAAFVVNDDSDELLALLAIFNAGAFRSFVDQQMAFGSYEVGVIQRTPIPNLKPIDRLAIAQLAGRAWSLKRCLDSHTENSHAFSLPALLQASGEALSARSDNWVERIRTKEVELSAIHADIDARCFDLYGIEEDDRRLITEGFGAGVISSGSPEEPDDQDDADADDGDTEGHPDEAVLAAELVSWMVGVAFGRFDIRLASGARVVPDQPEPFDAMPVCSPAMLTGEDGLPLSVAPSGYPIAFPENGILVDDLGHARDLTAAVRVVFEKVFNASADARWNEVGALLDSKDHDLRAWLAASFFEHHLKRHSKSRRKAPILWQLAVPSGRYSIWLYAHSLTTDTFFQIQNDVVTPKLAHEERQLASLMQGAGTNPSAMERKEIAAQVAFVDEVRQLLDEIKRVAPLWIPSLNDGVVLTMSPLWRLVPQHKTWQKELKSKWHLLGAGKYDWADIAMRLWPERVVPKCATDRSLAIAHGLEDLFWVEGADDGKWKPRSIPRRTVDELILERSSPAVKSALKILLESPDSAHASRRRRSDTEGVAMS